MEQQPSRRDPVDEPEEYDLVGFVLGALEPDEHARVAEAVQRSPVLQEAVDQLYGSLPKCEESWRSERPPSGLARRACAKVVEIK